MIIDKLVKALKEDEGYRIGWEANIAVCMQDAYKKAKDKKDIHSISNEGAKMFIDLLCK